MKPARLTARNEAVEHPLKVAQKTRGIFIADADQQRSFAGNRRAAGRMTPMRRHQRRRVARKNHQREADHRIPEADRRPRQRQREEQQHGDAGRIGCGGEQRGRHQNQQRHGTGEHKRGETDATTAQCQAAAQRFRRAIRRGDHACGRDPIFAGKKTRQDTLVCRGFCGAMRRTCR